MVMFFEPPPGSMPSVLRAQRAAGVSILTPQTVKPLPPLYETWKLGEFFRVMRYSVKLSAWSADDEAGDLLRAARARLLGEIPCALVLPRSFSPPRPSMTPSPMTPAPETCETVMSGLQPPPAGGDDAATAGRSLHHGGIEGFKESDAFVYDQRDSVAELKRATKEGVRGAVGDERDAFALGAVIDSLLDPVGVELGFVGEGKSVELAVVDRGKVRVEAGAEGGNLRFHNFAGVLREERGYE